MAVASVAAILYLSAAYVIAEAARPSKRHRPDRGESFKGSDRYRGSMVGGNEYPTSMMAGGQPGYPDPYMMTAAYQYPDAGNYGYPAMMGYDNPTRKY